MTFETVRDNIGKILFASTGSIIAIVGALFAIDARYAHAADVAQDKYETQQLVQDSSLQLRKLMIEDKLFELDFKKAQAKEQNKSLTPMEGAQRDRYKRQLDEINQGMKDNRSSRSLTQ